MGSLQPGVDIHRPEADFLADHVLDAFHMTKVEKIVATHPCSVRIHSELVYQTLEELWWVVGSRSPCIEQLGRE